MQHDPFAELGLPALADLTDDDVRAAWRRIAAATHPDREDGGDPVRFGAAAAAYALLRTSFGRGEALADLGAGAAAGRPRRARRPRHPGDARGPWDPRHPREPRLLWDPRRRGAHRLRVAAPSGRYRHARDAGLLRAVLGRYRHARDAGLLRYRHAREARYRHAGYVSIDRGLALPAGGAALAAAASVAAAGWTPATIGLVAGALTVTAWGVWRRAWRDR